jgi:3-oxoacyl-[acyl-carrier protein] reductase
MSSTKPTAIISGGMGGIGRAIALKLSAEGFHICILYHASSQQEAEEFLCTLAGEGHLAIACDITDQARVENAAQTFFIRHGRIDAAIHAAVSPLIRQRASKIALKDFRQQFEVTTFGGLQFFQAVIPYMMKEKNGKIIGITTAAIEPDIKGGSMAGYLAAKQALRAMLRELAGELESSGIAVAAVAPDFVPTKLHNDLPERAIELFREAQPDKKLTTPEDVAEVVANLCKAKESSISGMSFLVGGGKPTKL